MIPLPTHAGIFLYAHPADIRKSFCGLAGIARAELGREPLVGALDFDAAVEIGLEKVNLSFTHRVVFSVFEGFCFLPVKRGRSRDGFLFSQKVGE